MAIEELTIEEIDEVLRTLELVTDETTLSNGAIKQSANKYALYLECPTDIWDTFIEYCMQNELDPAQQVREAAIAHYVNLLQTYKIRKRLSDDSALV